MPRVVQILFGVIGLVLIVYFVVLGLAAFLDWYDPSSSTGGRVPRLMIGALIGVGLTLGFVFFRNMRR